MSTEVEVVVESVYKPDDAVISKIVDSNEALSI